MGLSDRQPGTAAWEGVGEVRAAWRRTDPKSTPGPPETDRGAKIRIGLSERP